MRSRIFAIGVTVGLAAAAAWAGPAASGPDPELGQLMSEAAFPLKGCTASQLLAVVQVGVDSVAGLARTLAGLSRRLTEAHEAVTVWENQVRQAKEAGDEPPALELNRRRQALERLRWDRAYTRRQALQRLFELAMAEHLLAQAGRKLDPSSYGLEGAARGVAMAVLTQRLGPHLDPEQRPLIVSILKQMAAVADRLGLSAPAGAAQAQTVSPGLCRLPRWRFGDRWEVVSQSPDGTTSHGLFVLKGIAWTASTVQYEVGLYTAATAHQKHAWTATLYFESRLEGRPDWPDPAQEGPAARDLYVFELRFRDDPSQPWTRQEFKHYSAGPFPCIGLHAGIRLDFPYLAEGLYVPDVGRYFAVHFVQTQPTQETFSWDTLQRLGPAQIDGQATRIPIDLIRPREGPGKAAAVLRWRPEEGWWEEATGQGYTTRLVAVHRLENSPLELLAEIRAGRARGQVEGWRRLVAPPLGDRLTDAAAAGAMDLLLRQLKELRPARLAFTRSDEARLRAEAPDRFCTIPFRLVGQRWTLHESLFREGPGPAND